MTTPAPTPRPCTYCYGSGIEPGASGDACTECLGRGTRHIRAGHVVRGDIVMLPGRRGGTRFPAEVTAASQGYRRQDEGKPDEARQRRRLEARTPFDTRAPSRVHLRPFGERVEVVRLVTDA